MNRIIAAPAVDIVNGPVQRVLQEIDAVLAASSAVLYKVSIGATKLENLVIQTHTIHPDDAETATFFLSVVHKIIEIASLHDDMMRIREIQKREIEKREIQLRVIDAAIQFIKKSQPAFALTPVFFSHYPQLYIRKARLYESFVLCAGDPSSDTLPGLFQKFKTALDSYNQAESLTVDNRDRDRIRFSKNRLESLFLYHCAAPFLSRALQRIPAMTIADGVKRDQFKTVLSSIVSIASGLVTHRLVQPFFKTIDWLSNTLSGIHCRDKDLVDGELLDVLSELVVISCRLTPHSINLAQTRVSLDRYPMRQQIALGVEPIISNLRRVIGEYEANQTDPYAPIGDTTPTFWEQVQTELDSIPPYSTNQSLDYLHQYSIKIKDLFKTIISESCIRPFDFFGYRYGVCFVGSSSRSEMHPQSDLEFFIVYDAGKTVDPPQFSAMIQYWIEFKCLQVNHPRLRLDLPPEGVPIYDYGTFGTFISAGKLHDPADINQLHMIATAEFGFGSLEIKEKIDQILAPVLSHSVSLGRHLFQHDVRRHLEEFHKSDSPKKQFYSPLMYLSHALAFLSGVGSRVTGTSTPTLVDNLVAAGTLSPLLGYFLKHSISDYFDHRLTESGRERQGQSVWSSGVWASVLNRVKTEISDMDFDSVSDVAFNFLSENGWFFEGVVSTIETLVFSQPTVALRLCDALLAASKNLGLDLTIRSQSVYLSAVSKLDLSGFSVDELRIIFVKMGQLIQSTPLDSDWMNPVLNVSSHWATHPGASADDVLMVGLIALMVNLSVGADAIKKMIGKHLAGKGNLEFIRAFHLICDAMKAGQSIDDVQNTPHLNHRFFAEDLPFQKDPSPYLRQCEYLLESVPDVYRRFYHIHYGFHPYSHQLGHVVAAGYATRSPQPFGRQFDVMTPFIARLLTVDGADQSRAERLNRRARYACSDSDDADSDQDETRPCDRENPPAKPIEIQTLYVKTLYQAMPDDIQSLLFLHTLATIDLGLASKEISQKRHELRDALCKQLIDIPGKFGMVIKHLDTTFDWHRRIETLPQVQGSERAGVTIRFSHNPLALVSVVGIDDRSNVAGLYWRFNPKQPARDYAASVLADLIFGRGRAAVEIGKLENGDTVSAVLVSDDRMGCAQQQNLSALSVAAREESGIPNPEMDLAPGAFSESCLLAILMYPKNGSPDHYRLARDRLTSRCRIVCCNSEMLQGEGFNPVTGALMVQSVLFCMDFMNDEIDPDVRRHFCALNLKDVFRYWLHHISHKNDQYRQLFSTEELVELNTVKKTVTPDDFLDCADQDLYSSVDVFNELVCRGYINSEGRLTAEYLDLDRQNSPIFLNARFNTKKPVIQRILNDIATEKTNVLLDLESDGLSKIYHRLLRMQSILNDSPPLRHIDLLVAVDPNLAAVYIDQLALPIGFLDRFNQLNQTHVVPVPVMPTTSQKYDPFSFPRFDKNRDHDLKMWVQLFEQGRQFSQLLDEIKRCLANWDLSKFAELFQSLPSVEHQADLINQTDFSKIKPVKPSELDRLIGIIGTVAYQQLTLTGLTVSADQLSQILSRSKETLSDLTLTNCCFASDKIFTEPPIGESFLKQKVPQLRHLVLENIKGISKISLQNKKNVDLTTLVIRCCTDLQSIQINQNNLETVLIEACNQLRHLGIDGLLSPSVRSITFDLQSLAGVPIDQIRRLQHTLNDQLVQFLNGGHFNRAKTWLTASATVAESMDCKESPGLAERMRLNNRSFSIAPSTVRSVFQRVVGSESATSHKRNLSVPVLYTRGWFDPSDYHDRPAILGTNELGHDLFGECLTCVIQCFSSDLDSISDIPVIQVAEKMKRVFQTTPVVSQGTSHRLGVYLNLLLIAVSAALQDHQSDKALELADVILDQFIASATANRRVMLPALRDAIEAAVLEAKYESLVQSGQNAINKRVAIETQLFMMTQSQFWKDKLQDRKVQLAGVLKQNLTAVERLLLGIENPIDQVISDIDARLKQPVRHRDSTGLMRALPHSKDMFLTLYGLGTMFSIMARTDHAICAFNKLISIPGYETHTQTHLHLGNLYLKTGDYELATASFNVVLGR